MGLQSILKFYNNFTLFFAKVIFCKQVMTLYVDFRYNYIKAGLTFNNNVLKFTLECFSLFECFALR